MDVFFYGFPMEVVQFKKSLEFYTLASLSTCEDSSVTWSFVYLQLVSTLAKRCTWSQECKYWIVIVHKYIKLFGTYLTLMCPQLLLEPQPRVLVTDEATEIMKREDGSGNECRS